MMLKKECLDMVLVPSGLSIMFGYHLFLLYRILRFPQTTVIGYENHNKRAWVACLMKGIPSDSTSIALQVISSNITASTYLASMSIALSSLIGTLVGSSSKVFSNVIIYGDTSPATTSIKYIALLTCFLVAFTAFIQSARYWVHANFLMSTPDSSIPVSYVRTAIIRGSNFWSVGLRALYVATTLLLWIFGPIPMFACSLIMVVALHILDSNSNPLIEFNVSSRESSEKKMAGVNSQYTPHLQI